LGDIPEQVTYRSQSGTPTRDLDAGTSTLAHTDYVLKQVIICKFSIKEADRDITLLKDEKVIILSDDLPVTPNDADLIIDRTGRTWQVIQQMRDPAGVIQVLRVRTTE
jgi:hypothetical protein